MPRLYAQCLSDTVSATTKIIPQKALNGEIAQDRLGCHKHWSERTGEAWFGASCDFRFGSKADINHVSHNVRFTPNSGHAARLP